MVHYDPPSPVTRQAIFPAAGIQVRAARYAPGTIQRPHEHRSGTMTLVYRGAVVERVADREERAGALSVVVKPPGIRHANRFGPEGASTLQIEFEPALLDEWGGEWRLGEWRWIHDGAAARPFLALLAALQDCRGQCAEEDEPGVAGQDGDLESLVYDLCAAVAPTAVPES